MGNLYSGTKKTLAGTKKTLLKYTYERCVTTLVHETGIREKLDYWREMCITNPMKPIDTYAELVDSYGTEYEHYHSKQIQASEVFQTDPYALKLYENALKHGTEKDKCIRVNIVGNFNQGKTSLLRRLLGQSIDEVKSTNGIDIEKIECKISNDGMFLYEDLASDDPMYVKRIFAIAESERMTSKREVSATLKAVNETEHTNSIENSEESSVLSNDEEFRSQRRDTNTIRKANVSDHVASKPKKALLNPGQLSKLVVKAKQTTTKLNTTKADIQTRFSFWDFGGQFLFYATHSLFHSRRAIYILVFDLSTNLSSVIVDTDCPVIDDERTMQYYFEFWMNSIHSFVGTEDGSKPLVLLVGTHKDKVPGDEQTRKKSIDKYFDGIRNLFDGSSLSKHIFPHDFAVDNTLSDDVTLADLRRWIIEIGNQISATSELPARWLPLELSMEKSKYLKVISFSQIKDIDSENEFPINDVEEIKLFLRYHHAKGTYIYFDEPHLSEYIFVDPQFVVDAFKSIITCERFTKNDPSIRPLWQKLLSEGKLEDKLIEVQWCRNEDFIKHKDILLMALKKHNILSEVTKYDEETNKSAPTGWYIVPSFLRNSVYLKNKENFFHGKLRTVIRFVMKFKISNIVPVVFHRLLSASIGRWSVVGDVTKPMIFQNLCVVRLDRDHAGVLELNLDCIELWLVSLSPAAINCDQADRFRRFAESVVQYEFRKLKQADDQYIRPYTACYKCNDESHGVAGSEKIEEIEYLDGSEFVICPDLKSHSSFTVVKAKSQWFTEINLTKQEAAVLLTDKVISRISQHIGKDWEQLGQQLGLTRAQIDHIIEEYPINATARRFRMLQIWLNESENIATIGKLVDAMKMCSSVKVDWNEIRNLAEECTYGIEESTTMGGEQFRKSVDDTMNETTVRLMREGMKSVGVLVYPGGYGTVFRVGSKCVMTAWHLVQNVLDGSSDTSRLEESDVYVDFNESCTQPHRKVYHLTKTVMHERAIDMAILEISDPDENLPSALYLDKNIDAVAKFETVSVIGYGHPQKMEKLLDPNCKVIPPNSPQIIHAIRWLSEKSSKFKQIMSMTLKDAALVDQGYRGYDLPAKFLMHCYLQHGASGAPVVAINGLKLVVVGMLTHGLPEFYFKLSETHKKLVDNELLFEVGSRMSSIYLCIQSKDPNLARNLFGE